MNKIKQEEIRYIENFDGLNRGMLSKNNETIQKLNPINLQEKDANIKTELHPQFSFVLLKIRYPHMKTGKNILVTVFVPLRHFSYYIAFSLANPLF